jgi:hypothetical protein
MLKGKKTLGITLLFVTTLATGMNAYAINQGLYLSGQMGWGNVHQTTVSKNNMSNLIGNALDSTDFTINTYNATVSDPTGIAGRGAIGWQYGSNWALEFGFSKFSNVQTQVNSTITDNTTGLPALAVENGNYQTDAFDLSGKAILPLAYNFSVNGSLGLAYLWGWPNEKVSVTESGVATGAGNNEHETRWYPTFGLGAGYDFTPQVQAVLSWNRIQQVGSSTHFVRSTDLVSIGLSLHFDTW